MAKRVYQLIKQEGQIIGDHVVGRGPDQRTYVSGDCIESDKDLIAEHPGKFVYAPPGAYDKFQGADLDSVPGAPSPIVGLPSRRTPSPKGPEEGGNTRAEIEEVSKAIETGEHDYKHRADPEAPAKTTTKVKKNVKVAPIAKTINPIDRPADDDEDDDEDEDRDLIDVADDDEDDEDDTPPPKKVTVKKGKKKKVKTTVKKAKPKPAEAEDEDE